MEMAKTPNTSQNRFQVSQPSESRMGDQLAFQGSCYQNLGHHQNDENYGRPVAGSKTEYRGKQAGVHISSEVVELCEVIKEIGQPDSQGYISVSFGDLFELYTRISNKVVGMLMRARKHGLVDFPGEMLFQRRDDDVLIRLVKQPEEFMDNINQQKAELEKHPSNKSRTH